MSNDSRLPTQSFVTKPGDLCLLVVYYLCMGKTPHQKQQKKKEGLEQFPTNYTHLVGKFVVGVGLREGY